MAATWQDWLYLDLKRQACNGRRLSAYDAYGGMAERFKAPVLKTGVGASSPWVRIPLPPPNTADCRIQ